MRKISFAEYANARDEMEINEAGMPWWRATKDRVSDFAAGIGNAWRQSRGRSKDNKEIYQGIKDVEDKEEDIKESLTAAIDDTLKNIEEMPSVLTKMMNDVRTGIKQKIDNVNGNLNKIFEDLQALQTKSGVQLVTPDQMGKLKNVYGILKKTSDDQSNILRNMMSAMSKPVGKASEMMGGLMKSYDNIRGNIQGMLADIAANLEQQAAAGAIARQEYTPKTITGGGSGGSPTNAAKVMRGTYNPRARKGGGGPGTSTPPDLSPFDATTPSGEAPRLRPRRPKTA